jgi:hypothetical protein
VDMRLIAGAPLDWPMLVVPEGPGRRAGTLADLENVRLAPQSTLAIALRGGGGNQQLR